MVRVFCLLVLLGVTHAGEERVMAERHQTGDGVKKDQKASIAWFKKAAAKGDAIAMARLAGFHSGGLGVPRDSAKASALFRRAAERGHAPSQVQVGLDLEQRQPAEAARWYEKAARSGDVDAFVLLGELRARARAQEQASHWYRLAAAKGHAESQRVVGARCEFGAGVPRDRTAALAWYRRAAKQGEARAQYALGRLLRTGDWFEKAAAQGEPNALNALAGRATDPARRYLLYARAVASDPRFGKKVRRNHTRPRELALGKLAARHPAARYELGRLLWFGYGVKRDEKRARELWKSAAAAGHAGATARLAGRAMDPARDPDAAFAVGRRERDLALLTRAARAGHAGAVRWFHERRLDGAPEVVFQIALMKREGLGFEVDPLYERHLRRAAGSGHAGARALVGADWRESAEEETFRRRVEATRDVRAATRLTDDDPAAALEHAARAYRFFAWNNGVDHARTDTLAALVALLAGQIGREDRAAEILGTHEPAARLMTRALSLAKQGRPGDAAPLYERAIPKLVKSHGPTHRFVLQATSQAANLYDAALHYDDAAPLHARAVALAEAAFSEQSPERRAVYRNYAFHLDTRGLFQAAGKYRRKVWDLAATAPATDPSAITDRISEARTLLNIKERERAATIMVDIRLRVAACGRNTSATTQLEVGLLASEIDSAFGREAEALARTRTALAAAKTRAQRARIRGTLGRQLVGAGRAAEAAPHFVVAGNLYALRGGAYRMLAAGYRRLAAAALWAGGDMAAAAKEARGAATATDSVYGLLLESGNEVEQHRQLTLAASETDFIVALNADGAPDDPVATGLALRTVLRRKGRVLDAATDTARLLRERTTPETRKLLAELGAVRDARAALTLGLARDTDPGELAKRERDLYYRERALTGRLAEQGRRTSPVLVSTIAKLLPEDAALVEIVAYHPFDPHAQTWVMGGEHIRYAAYVLRRKTPPRVVALGDGAVIDRAAIELIESLKHPSRDAKKTARRLDGLVLQPLLAHLEGVSHLLIAPDARLNLVPFGALIDGAGRFAIERWNLSYLTSGRDLLRLRDPAPPASAPLLIGAPNYGDRGRFTPLPGTAEEVAAIAKVVPGARLLQGDRAREQALRDVRSPRLLHIATHGFFDGHRGAGVGAGTRGLDRVSPGSRRPRARLPGDIKNPLARAGLALAGANSAKGGTDDGILTALDVTLLDLRGTELVVLSACETAVGRVERKVAHFNLYHGVKAARRRGSTDFKDVLRYARQVATVLDRDGVYGLRRALVIAGSRSQVMSLWKVDDKATRDLMIAYYQALAAGAGRAEALRRVQLKMLADPKRRHPFYWAAFIASGGWAPLPR